jgi:hypothetical protein
MAAMLDLLTSTPERFPCPLAVACDDDQCGVTLQGDWLVTGTDSHATRLGYILDHAERSGWQIIGRDQPETAVTFCPAHHQDDPAAVLARPWANPAHAGMLEPHNCDRCRKVYDEASGDGYCGLCPSCADATEPEDSNA